MQKLRYRITVNGNDVTDFISSCNTTARVGSVPTASITLTDPECWVSQKYGLDSNQPVTIHGSVDGTAPSILLFNGMTTASNPVTDSSGANSITLSCSGAGPIASAIVGPNQVAYRGVELREVFQGHTKLVEPDSPNVYWRQDERGNYPNGLLYQTGYALENHAGDIIEDAIDVPTPITFNGLTLYSAISRICEIYGLTFWFNDSDRTVHIARTPIYGDGSTNFPSSGVTFTYGVEINSEDISRDGGLEYDKVTVVGSSPSLFYTVGTGKKELPVNDPDLTSREAVIEKALRIYAIRSGETRSMRLPVIAYPHSLVGMSITVVDPRRSLSLYKNVVGQSHSITGDRWTTTLDLETTRRTTGKIVAEILDELKNSKEITTKALAYLKGEGGIRSDKAAYSNICGVAFCEEAGIHHNRLPDNGRGVLKHPTDIVVLDDGTNCVYGMLNPTEMMGRVQEVALLGNTLEDGELHEVEVDATSDPSSQDTFEITVGNSTNYYQKIATIPAMVDGEETYPIEITGATGDLGGNTVYGSIGGESARIVSYTRFHGPGTISVVDGKPYSTPPSILPNRIIPIDGLFEDEFVEGGTTEAIVPANRHTWNKKDGISKHHSFTDPNDEQKIVRPHIRYQSPVIMLPPPYNPWKFQGSTNYTYLEFNTTISEGGPNAISQILVALRHRVGYVKNDATNRFETLDAKSHLYVYRPHHKDWEFVRDLSDNQDNLYMYPFGGDGHKHPWVGDDGKMVFCITTVFHRFYDDLAVDRSTAIEIKYASLSFRASKSHMYMPEYDEVWEVAPVDADNLTFRLSYPPSKIVGVWNYWRTNEDGKIVPETRLSKLKNPNLIRMVGGYSNNNGTFRTRDDMYDLGRSIYPNARYFDRAKQWNMDGRSLNTFMSSEWERPLQVAREKGAMLFQYKVLKEPDNFGTLSPSVYEYPLSNFYLLPYSNMRGAYIMARCGNGIPTHSSEVKFTVECVKGRMVGTYRAGRDDRLKDGVEMDGLRELHFVGEIDPNNTGTDGTGWLSGSGTDRPYTG